MKYIYKRNSKGFTLIELIIVLGFVGLIILISSNLLIFGANTSKLVTKDYYMQSEIRRTTEKANELIRYSKAVFAVPKSFVESTDVMDPGWNYLMVTNDSKRIVTMEYDETLDKHIEKNAVEASADILYYIEFEKYNEDEEKSDKVIKYEIYAYNADKDGNKINEKLVFESTVEAVNAIQIIDKGTESSPSVALAFRSDGQTSGKGKNQRAYITIIVDTSNSMNKAPDGSGSNTNETLNSRITKVRKALVGDGTDTGNGIIQQFAKEENVFLSIIPFANTANYPSPHSNHQPDAIHPEYEVYESNELTSLLGVINNLQADGHNSWSYGSGHGGTNTGDALRRAYYLHENYRAKNNIDPKDQVHHYIMMLVDGETTFETSYVDWEDDGLYTHPNTYYSYGEYINSDWHYRFNWETDWKKTISNDLLPDGNINIEYFQSYSPEDETLSRSSYYNGTINYYSYYYRRVRTYNGNIVKYGEKNDDFSNILITGDGSSVISDSDYIQSIGNAIKNFDSGINSYIIGYANDLGNHVNGIGDDIGTLTDNIYRYDDPNFDLDTVFKNIATDIMADFWLATGPQIME